MATLRDLHVKVAAAIEAMPANVKADVDAAFAEHGAAPTPAKRKPTAALKRKLPPKKKPAKARR